MIASHQNPFAPAPMVGTPGIYGPGAGAPAMAAPPASTLWDRIGAPATAAPTIGPISAPEPGPSFTPAPPATPQMQQPTVWDRIGGALQQPGMAGAFLRAAGAAFNGDGLGGAIQAGAQSMDHTHAQQQATAQQAFENQMLQFRAQHQAAQDAAARGKTDWKIIPEGGRMVAFDAMGNPVDPAQANPGAPAPSAPSPPTPGAIYKGHRFLGGDPSNPASWAAAGGAPSQGGAMFP